MAEPWNWDETDIENLIHEAVQESLSLDYKRCASLDKQNPNRRAELSKDVSAFANSAGGTLVYGVEEDNHLPVRIDDGYDPADLTREWIEQVINSTIQRRIDGVRIKQIELRKGHPGRVMYVVYVPQSTRAPHIASDHVFYKRYNYQSIPMEEYEVRDVARRFEGPDLRISISMVSPDRVPVMPDAKGKYEVSIRASIQNKAPTPAHYIVTKLFIAQEVSILDPAELRNMGPVKITIDGVEHPTIILNLNWSSATNMPIWEGVTFDVCANPIRLAIPGDELAHILTWEIHSPSMEPQKGIYYLTASPVEDSSFAIIRLRELQQ